MRWWRQWRDRRRETNFDVANRDVHGRTIARLSMATRLVGQRLPHRRLRYPRLYCSADQLTLCAGQGDAIGYAANALLRCGDSSDAVEAAYCRLVVAMLLYAGLRRSGCWWSLE